MTSIEDDKLLWLRLWRVPGLGPVSGMRLLKALGSPADIFRADYDDLISVEGISPGLARAVQDRSHAETAARDLDLCQNSGIEVLYFNGPGYPARLLAMPAPPLVLFVKGKLPGPEVDAVAMVGCRTPDPYGEGVAASLASGLARHGLAVVSGMARGIDGICQRSALKAGGVTVAVLGTGVDVPYPREHKKLYDAILETGGVVSEFPPGTAPDAKNFPRRNRIISGLSLGVIMVQAMNERSGALITVRHALEQDRLVFAVPGNAGSRGGRIGNNLIKQGALLVETAEDVLTHLKPLQEFSLAGGAGSGQETERPSPRLPDLQARLYGLVPGSAEGTADMDTLARLSGVSPQAAAGALLELELAGLIRALPGKRYVRLTEL